MNSTTRCLFTFLFTWVSASTADADVIPPVSSGSLLLHLDSRVGVTESAGSVVSWADQSGNGNHFTRSGTGTIALVTEELQTGIFNPVLKFPGGGTISSPNAILQNLGGNFSASSVDDITVFAVMTLRSQGGWISSRANGNVDWASGFDLDQYANNTAWGAHGDRLEGRGQSGLEMRTNSDPFGTFRIVSHRSTRGGGYDFHFDGVLEGNQATGIADVPISLFNVTLGSRDFGAPAQMDLAAVLIYDGALSDPDRLSIQNYLSDEFYGTSLSVGAAVPEPGSFALLGLGAIGTAFVKYRRRSKTRRTMDA